MPFLDGVFLTDDNRPVEPRPFQADDGYTRCMAAIGHHAAKNDKDLESMWQRLKRLEAEVNFLKVLNNVVRPGQLDEPAQTECQRPEGPNGQQGGGCTQSSRQLRRRRSCRRLHVQ